MLPPFPHRGARLGAAAGLFVLLASVVVAGPKIGVLLKDRSPGFWIHAEKGAVETARSLGAELIVKAPPSVLDVSAQARLLSALANESLDAIVIAPTNPEAVEPVVAGLVAKGVKVVIVDTPLQEGIGHAFVGADQAAMAEAAAKVFVGLLKAGDEAALLRNNSVDRTVMTREDTVRQALRAVPNVVLHADVFASSEKDTEDERAQVLFAKHPKTVAVFASATRGTLSTIKAIREKGLVGKVKVVGFGTYLPAEAAKAFEDGILYGWVAQQPKELGVKAVEAAVALVKDEKVTSPIRPEFVLVTPENFKSPAVQALMQP